MATKSVVAGELYESITGQLFEIGRQLRQKGGYPYNPLCLKQALQDAIEGRFGRRGYELYLSPSQRKGRYTTGFELDQLLNSERLIDRTFDLDDPLVKGWITDPSSYPEEFKGKVILLWKSQRGSGNDHVAYLIWGTDLVVVGWQWLSYRMYDNFLVLLASS